MVNEFCGFKHGVIGTDKMPADTTLNNMKKADLIKLLHTAQHNYETLMWFYNNAVQVNMSQLNNNGWIPCSERLPEDKQKVLIWYENGHCSGMSVATFKKGKTKEELQTMERLCIGFTDQWGNNLKPYAWDGDGPMEWDGQEVIAWQPLPAPYTERE